MDADILHRNLDAAIRAHDFSGVISIQQEGRTLYEAAAGYADRSNRIQNTPETRFGIASGTKFFTALAIGKLLDAGRIGLSTKLTDCVSLDFPSYAPGITIQHLLTHTSGIPDYFDEEQIDDFDNFTVSVPWYELKGPKDYLAVFPDEGMKFNPGTQFSYSNGGYILLGVIIEELTGISYQEFVTQQILEPTGMAHSGFFAMNKLPAQTALGYIEEDGGKEECGEWRTNIYNLPIIGASDGGLFSTIADISALWTAFWANQILSKELVELYTTPHAQESPDEDSYYGMGIWIDSPHSPSRSDYIVGSDAGVSFKSSVNRATDTQVTVISNTSDGAWPILKAISHQLSDTGL